MADLVDQLKAALADRYAIDHEIGRGGMATVYLAEDLKHHRKVAVKVLLPEGFDGRWRVLRETPRPLSDVPDRISPFSVAPDGERFLVVVANPDAPSQEIYVVLNLFEVLK